MPKDSIGVAVIGAGMAGRAHAFGYRSATSVFGLDLPDVRLVSIADLNQDLAADTARRYGFSRTDASWEAIVDADDIDAVSVVVANPLHREIVEALAAAGKHVLCEKPLAPSAKDAQAMIEAVDRAGVLGRVGFTFRRSPAICAIREEILSGRLGRVLHFSGQYWNDYACDPQAPMSWRYKGPVGSGALADVGSHISDLAEFLCGPVESVHGATLTTQIAERPLPLGAVVGHQLVSVSDETEPVENDDWASYCLRFAEGGSGTISASRIAHGHPNTLKFEVFCEHGAATFDQSSPAEFGLITDDLPDRANGYRRVLVGHDHPYMAQGMPMDGAGIGLGHNESFIFQARAFLDEIAGNDTLPRCASLSEGLHNLNLLDAVVGSATTGSTVRVP
ncbi:Gfo/Idh/MocA family protein [Amycolatopsis sp. NPDC098790]|uniref:Gfo/Idh/MocA family protein n=1 Tax=Amycolatopsis sp. NPDC098790 TaxID=3363939 RepID=UPI0038030926